MSRRNLLRSWLTAALSIVAVMAAGLLTVRPVPAGAADRPEIDITVSDAGFNPPVVSDVNVGDVLIFKLHAPTDYEHKIIFEDHSVCPGRRGAVPCWPELRFDDPATANCWNGKIEPDWRCLIVQDPGKTVPFYDGFNPANRGEIRVLGQPTTTTGPSTTTTTAPPTTTTTAPTTTTTWSDTTTTTAPKQVRPFVIPDPPSTTSTMAAPAPVVVTNTSGSPAPTATKNKDNDKGKAKAKAAGTETPTTLSPPPSDAMPPDSVFDPAALTPGPGLVPVDANLNGDGEINLESAAVMNLLARDEAADRRPLLLSLCALAFLLALGGIWRWFTRPSRYDPA